MLQVVCLGLAPWKCLKCLLPRVVTSLTLALSLSPAVSPLPLDEAYFRGLHPLCVWRYRWASKLRLPIPRAYPYRQSRVLEGQARCIIHLPELTYLVSYRWDDTGMVMDERLCLAATPLLVCWLALRSSTATGMSYSTRLS